MNIRDVTATHTAFEFRIILAPHTPGPGTPDLGVKLARTPDQCGGSVIVGGLMIVGRRARPQTWHAISVVTISRWSGGQATRLAPHELWGNVGGRRRVWKGAAKECDCRVPPHAPHPVVVLLAVSPASRLTTCCMSSGVVREKMLDCLYKWWR